TDLLLYLLLAGLTTYGFITLRSARLREPWRRVFARPVGAATAVMLLAFLAVAVLDSVHYKPPVTNDDGTVERYGPEVISLFDALVTPLRVHDEKTYSAPFATRLYVREMVTQDDGTVAFVYQPLRYGGSLLQEDTTRRADLLAKALRGFGWGALAAAGVTLAALAVAMALTRRRFTILLHTLLRGRTQVAWRSMWLVTVLLLIGIGMLVSLSD